MQITSINNPKVKEWSKLKLKKYRDLTNLFIIENEHLINEAKKNNFLKETIGIECSSRNYEWRFG